MPPDHAVSLRALARLLVRFGLNLQPGQRLLVAEPYELQGVAREAAALVEAVSDAATAAGARDVTVVWGDAARLRQLVGREDWPGFRREIGTSTRLLHEFVRQRDALLFLQSSHLDLMAGLPPGAVNEFRHIVWEHFGPIAQLLTVGATNWTVASAPIPTWAQAVRTDLPPARRLDGLWEDLFAAMRVGEPDPLAAWEAHLHRLREHAATLNAQRTARLRYRGAGTDLTVSLPPEHVWCTACLQTGSGLPFVANLPTEEVFTAPHRDSAEGIVRVARPVNYGGVVIDGITLEFKRGRVVRADARRGGDLLKSLLETDDGAARLGEVALVPEETSLGRSGRLFFNPLLDENATSHLALGEAYAFCFRFPNPAARNRSLIHVDLPVDCRPEAAGP